MHRNDLEFSYNCNACLESIDALLFEVDRYMMNSIQGHRSIIRNVQLIIILITIRNRKYQFIVSHRK